MDTMGLSERFTMTSISLKEALSYIEKAVNHNLKFTAYLLIEHNPHIPEIHDAYNKAIITDISSGVKDKIQKDTVFIRYVITHLGNRKFASKMQMKVGNEWMDMPKGVAKDLNAPKLKDLLANPSGIVKEFVIITH